MNDDLWDYEANEPDWDSHWPPPVPRHCLWERTPEDVAVDPPEDSPPYVPAEGERIVYHPPLDRPCICGGTPSSLCAVPGIAVRVEVDMVLMHGRMRVPAPGWGQREADVQDVVDTAFVESWSGSAFDDPPEWPS